MAVNRYFLVRLETAFEGQIAGQRGVFPKQHFGACTTLVGDGDRSPIAEGPRDAQRPAAADFVGDVDAAGNVVEVQPARYGPDLDGPGCLSADRKIRNRGDGDVPSGVAINRS